MSQKHEIIDANSTAHDQAVRMMAVWISAIADQVKNPVAGISAAASLIEKQMSAFRAAEAWDPAIVEEAVRLMLGRLSRFDNYLSELSGFTREVKLDLKWWNFVEHWPSIEQAIIRKVPLDFRLNLNVSSDVRLYADFERVTSAIASLVLNSVEACGISIHSVVIISIDDLIEENSGRRGVRILVEDNGPGFSKHALLEGLVPFFTTKDAGTGLGLAMVEKYIRAHGGWVKLTNKMDEEKVLGAVVELFFPLP
jgi:nitrogen fixation/metabolism regulation signal transduction histidine kinase